ncbi:MAG: UDP-glucose 4-epimerase GalE [Gemmatimonadetes bacterium]|nr:UDP-glucose 4-epimerase GalE [Gemmatimonadota bacterium]
MKILVTGGAGYIGSHTVKELSKEGYRPVILDNLSEGHRGALTEGSFHEVSLDDRDAVKRVVESEGIDAAIHFAASCYVGESMSDPLKYYRNNSINALNLLEVLVEAGVRKFVFSSTCATYGDPVKLPLDEEHPQNPVNVYGETKLVVERVLRALDRSHDFRSVMLRYFNASGADPDGRLGEDHRPETHLIPLVLQVALGQRKEIGVYGDDYDTPDGTCIRDYIHVVDLAQAHVRALRYLENGGDSRAFNVGTGNGFSVREVIDSARRITGHPIPERVTPRREGDPAELVANSTRIRSELGWDPEFTSIDAIMKTAWEWHRAHPDGYAD